jgi:hypothetical protein
MPNVRVFPPAPGATGTANGRSYSTSSYLDVPDFDAAVLSANGWVSLGANCHGMVGPTSARPNPPGGSYYDTSLALLVTWVPAFPLASGEGNSLGRWCDTSGNSV